MTVLAMALLVAGCASAEPGTPTGEPTDDVMPADFAGTIHYGNGSVPPRYHYEWDLRITESTAELRWRPGYDEDVPAWERTVPIDRAQRERLYERLRDASAFEPAPTAESGLSGGSTGSVELVADGRGYDTGDLGASRAGQDILDAVQAAATELVPDEVWTDLRDKQDAWGAEQPG